MRPTLELLQWAHLYLQQRGSSLYDVMVDYSLLVLEETSPVLVELPLSLGPVAPLLLEQRTQWFFL